MRGDTADLYTGQAETNYSQFNRTTRIFKAG